jgi:hypothetical protein
VTNATYVLLADSISALRTIEESLCHEDIDGDFAVRAGILADSVIKFRKDLASIGEFSLVEDLLCRMESTSRELGQTVAKIRAMRGGE